ncbi:hypothetical protein JCM30471_28240 [Desulfuromonas carbonis]
MNERRDIGRILSDIEQEMKELEIAYEQYFAGVEKREPIKLREAMARRLRLFANRRIVQTDLRYRFQNLSTRFHTYCSYWDRILRLIEEGRYSRQQGLLPKFSPPAVEAPAAKESPRLLDQAPANPSGNGRMIDSIYQQLVEAHQACNLKVPQRQKVEEFLAQQKDKIREKFGDRPVEFRIDLAGGKPKLKVKAK